jgi:hypothetical protein
VAKDEVPPVEQQVEQTFEALPKLWERQPGETARAFAAFRRYLDLPAEDRTILNAAKSHVARSKARKKPSLKASERQFEKWSGENYWIMRAAAYDDSLAQIEYEATAEARRALGRKHVELVEHLTDKAIAAVIAVKIDDMSPRDVVRFADAAVKLSGIVHGGAAAADDPAGGSEDGPAPQDLIVELLSADPELAKSGARFGAQILRVKRERETDPREREA